MIGSKYEKKIVFVNVFFIHIHKATCLFRISKNPINSLIMPIFYIENWTQFWRPKKFIFFAVAVGCCLII